MVRKYVWRCDRKHEDLVRTELRLPADLRAVLDEAATREHVSLNAYVIAVLTFLATEDMQQRMQIETAPTPLRVSLKKSSQKGYTT